MVVGWRGTVTDSLCILEAKQTGYGNVVDMGVGDGDGEFFCLGRVKLELSVSTQVECNRVTNLRLWHAGRSGLETLEIHSHILTSVYFPLNTSVSLSLVRDQYLRVFFLR